jgi:Short C-terminal domain
MADDSELPAGLQLDAGEVILHRAKDWGVPTRPFVLTNQRLICPADPLGRGVAVIPFHDIREVRLRKPFIGYPTVVIERRAQPPVEIPAHINGERVRADIAAAVADAGAPARPPSSTGPEAAGADRYERLRRVGELRESGVLTEAEFEREKARILEEP